ncbi:hypothetical protein BGW36DRAFT_382275 [Talaromyces proteolyticus]|uniref:Uncharacterized protein n=1 Tax=Talaromyces proteolyticus TaxID=1131652 RepID=A0AAD4PZ16_9EURO|nr:uncharacterized protein BGW36DRAFT_382275 [Talaromyces proteolyticus]KAH8695204.1 hypothetical protein BGW36DRAFT_382275 [Talaromyces proteolyticus]
MSFFRIPAPLVPLGPGPIDKRVDTVEKKLNDVINKHSRFEKWVKSELFKRKRAFEELSQTMFRQHFITKRISIEMVALNEFSNHQDDKLRIEMESLRTEAALSKTKLLDERSQATRLTKASEIAARDSKTPMDSAVSVVLKDLSARISAVEERLQWSMTALEGRVDVPEVPVDALDFDQDTKGASQKSRGLDPEKNEDKASSYSVVAVRGSKSDNDKNSSDSAEVVDVTEMLDKFESYAKTFQALNDKVTAIANKHALFERSLLSDKKDLINILGRLDYAERVIGALYSPGEFNIQGQSFYDDATSLRYAASQKDARDEFVRFYGQRLDAIRYVDVMPPVLPLAFLAIARVRCSPELWEDRLALKREISDVTEKMIEAWTKTLPQGKGSEHAPWPDKELLANSSRLKMLCRRAYIDVD